jgi:hypothetical protein
VADHGVETVRVALSHLPDDKAINIGLAVNGQERAPTHAMAQDRFYGNSNPAVCASLPRGQITNSDVAFIASVVKKASKEQLEPEFIAQKVKTLESMDCRWFQPDTRCRFTTWLKGLIGEDLNFSSSLSKMRRCLSPSPSLSELEVLEGSYSSTPVSPSLKEWEMKEFGFH